MKASILSSVLFAASVLAAPRGGHGLARRVANRAGRLSNVANVLGVAEAIKDGNATHVEYSSNWAGGVLTAPPAGETFNAVSGQFTVPTPSAPPGGDGGSYSAAIWVGIDGDTYGNAILQAGVDITIDGSDSYSYDAWYEWYPNYAIDFSTSSFSFSAGDVISVSIKSSSSTRGTVVLENLSTGQSVTQSVSAPSSSAKLGGQNAEWIVEDFDEGGSQVAFADFGTVLFTDCVASTGSTSEGTSGATILDIEDSDGNILTDTTIPSSSEVKIVYT
ncbi:hypothetical protein M430DRAFT_110881 [Amorphotheca resinae ATCC 22711]|jgi:hypothetical protein|uniref:Uncharacterized protein n=1 Tax=Amorphotheca resinae ATCC 22711 TaxID=857342 RepID=A0A2T3AQA8_AMORE|nr:hypothetical protein M430DRAFT_110881 [Amorphotheca resinae ATCC 22711]PSS07190.1 hypothetical protein M430DRAFT_110881 [Amorphotheca resinae ATCC 22711]